MCELKQALQMKWQHFAKRTVREPIQTDQTYG